MAELANTSVFSQTDANNNSGTVPTWPEGMPPSQVNDSARALQGAVTREWNWRSFTLTAGGTADAKTLTYAVAPAAYYTGQIFSFIANTVNTGTATINVNGLGAKTIKKDVSGTMTALSAGDMPAGTRVMLAYDGTDMIWVNWQGSGSTAATTTEQLTGTSTSVVSTPDSVAALWEQGSDIASAGTISVGEGGCFSVTGTTTITDIDFATDKAGRKVWLKFTGALTLTHHSTTLILPTGANITTAAGDTACFVSEGSDNVRCLSYNRKSGAALAVSATGIAVVRRQVFTASGTYTPHASMLYCTVTATGGGGGGGGANASGSSAVGSGGGGAGGTARETYSAATIGASQTVTVGTGGGGGSNANGTDGNNTTFGALMTGNAGTGGTGNTTAFGAGGAGGAASGGDVNIYGGDGGSGFSISLTDYETTQDLYTGAGGVGGASFWGGGGRGGVNSVGAAANAYGSGGGGGGGNQSGDRDGGAGKDGIVEVIEYCSA